MPALSRRAVVIPVALAVFILCIAVIEWVDPVGVRRFGREANENAATSRQMDLKLEVVKRRIEIKSRLVNRLIAGQATLAEVTGQFLALEQEDENEMRLIRNRFPGATDEERMARNVIQYVLVGLPDPSENKRVGQRLATEFRGLFPAADKAVGDPAPLPIPNAPPFQAQSKLPAPIAPNVSCLPPPGVGLRVV